MQWRFAKALPRLCVQYAADLQKGAQKAKERRSATRDSESCGECTRHVPNRVHPMHVRRYVPSCDVSVPPWHCRYSIVRTDTIGMASTRVGGPRVGYCAAYMCVPNFNPVTDSTVLNLNPDTYRQRLLKVKLLRMYVLGAVHSRTNYGT